MPNVHECIDIRYLMQSFPYLHIVFLKIDMKASIKSSVTCLSSYK